MKVLFLTDVHDSRRAVEWVQRAGKNCSAIIVGGDLARGGGTQAFVHEFLRSALSTGQTVFYVPGNADSPEADVPEGVVLLHGRVAKLGAYTVGGLGGSNATPFKTPFELPDEDARSILSKLGRVDVLVSHCPPFDTMCDWAEKTHIGSVPVREYVEREQPMLVLSGHAHKSRAIDKVGGTTIVNAGPLMEGNYAEVTLSGGISVELKSDSF